MTGFPPPPPDEVTRGFWDATRRREFVLQRCLGCGHWQHYPRWLCTVCGGTELDFARACGRGTVDSFTIVHRAPAPGFTPPYAVARIRLAEGPLMLSTVIGCPTGAVVCDLPVQLDWQPLPDGRHLPVFRPLEA